MICVLYVFVMCMISLSYWFDTHHFFDRKKAQKKQLVSCFLATYFSVVWVFSGLIR